MRPWILFTTARRASLLDPALLNQSGSIPSLFTIPAFSGFAFPFEDQSRQRGEGIEPLRGREILEMRMAIEIRRFTGG
jgi:hypothetical protein